MEKSSLLTGCELNLSCFTTDQEENQTEDKSTAEPKSRVGFERVPGGVSECSEGVVVGFEKRLVACFNKSNKVSGADWVVDV